MKNIILALTIISLTACEIGGSAQNSEASCFATKYSCDTRNLQKMDGTEFYMCNAGIDQIESTMLSLGFTVEVDKTWDGTMDGAGSHTFEPSGSHFKLSNDSVNCLVDGQGPYHCGSFGSTFIVANSSLTDEIINQISSSNVSSCAEVQ